MKQNTIKSIILLLASVPFRTFAETPQPPTPDRPDGIIGGHEYVDLGLPSGTLWATYNVGATSPYEKGDYFAWGEVEPREDFSWESYKFFEGYEIDPNNGEWAVLENIGSDISGTEYDAARHQWGNGWRLLNEQERYELRMECWWNRPVMENGVWGVRIHGPNGHSIFLPICGFGLWYGQPDPFHDTSAAYWTGCEDPEYGYNGRPIEPSNKAKSFAVELYAGLTGATSPKAYGLNIRAVVNPKEAGIEDLTTANQCISLLYRAGNIRVIGSEAAGIINVVDLSGRTIYSGVTVDGSCTIAHITAGVYIATFISNDNKTVTQKITIK